MEKDCNVSALLKEASYFGLLGLETDLQQLAKEQAKVRKGDEFLLNVGGELFVTSKGTLIQQPQSRLAKMVEGELKQEFDKDGNLYIDCDPKDFVYVLKALRRRSAGPKTAVPKEVFSSVWGTAAGLGLDRYNRFGPGSTAKVSDLFQIHDVTNF